MSKDIEELRNELQSELRRVSAVPGSNTNKFLNNFCKMPQSDGIVSVRLLPSRTSKIKDIYQSTRIHSINKRTCHCPKVVEGEKWTGNCPICDYYNYLWQESKSVGGSEAVQLQTEARGLKPIERYYFNCIVRSQTGTYKDGENPLNTPLILSVGKQVFGKIIKTIIGCPEEMEPSLGDITDIVSGRDFTIVKKNKKGGDGAIFPSYDNSKIGQVSILGTTEQVDEWMEKMHDLPSLREVKSIVDLKREIRIHRGAEEDSATSFNISEYDAPSSNRFTRVPEKAPATPKVSHEEDQAILEDEFLSKLAQSEL